MENEKRLHRCCFTGHRPEKLTLSEKEVKSLLEKAIDNAIANGYVTFTTKSKSSSPFIVAWMTCFFSGGISHH